MYISIIFLCFFSALSAGFLGSYIGTRGIKVITYSVMVLITLLSISVFFFVLIMDNVIIYNLGTWVRVEDFTVEWGFIFDPLSTTLVLLIVLISALVHAYSFQYMEKDPHLIRFISYLSLFTFFMLILVTSNNFLQLFFGWEGVGICSYLLISFWFTRVQAIKAAMKALIMNRIGDCGLLLSIACFISLFQSLNFEIVFALTPLITDLTVLILEKNYCVITIVALLLFLGCVGKSAQLGLHTWLPDAMEGPTPVSALLHAATMVTAGIFLILRCSPIFEYAPAVLLIMVYAGLSTSFFAATTAIFQNDIKKIIAYSTCSQLGYMVFSCGLSAYELSLYHLFNHAFFKAALFLAAGVIIHSLGNEQDIRKMGGLQWFFPNVYVVFALASLSLCGFPYFSGFYSKDLILEAALTKQTADGFVTYIVAVLISLLTTFYSVRLIIFVFRGTYRGFIKPQQFHQPPKQMLWPLYVLSFLSVFSGYYFNIIFFSPGNDFFRNTIFSLPQNNIYIAISTLPFWLKFIPTYLNILSGLMSLYIYERKKYSWTLKFMKNTKIITFFNKKWFFDEIYNFTIKPFLRFCYNIYNIFDKGIIEIFGPTGLTALIYKIFHWHGMYKNGLLYRYVSFSVAVFIVIFFILEIF